MRGRQREWQREREHEEAERARGEPEVVQCLGFEWEAPRMRFEDVDYKAEKVAARVKSIEEKERRAREGEWTEEREQEQERERSRGEGVSGEGAVWRRQSGAGGRSLSLGSSYDVFVDEEEFGFLGAALL